jgi:drug/metabolite transporter (DMT)-like permease
MTGIALAIVLAAAFLHACWNYLAKKSRNKIVFIWWFLLAALVIYLPMLIYFWPQTIISRAGWLCIAATGVLHFMYFWFLGGAYERGDLSLVYPLSRGSGPLLVPLLAILFINEQLSALGAFGITLIIAGIYTIHLRSFSLDGFLEPFRAARGSASVWALLTGGTIAAYSLVDKVGVSLVHPPVYIYLMLAITWLFLSPLVLTKNREDLTLEWKTNRNTIFIVGFLVLGTYMLVLFALQMAKVSYVVAVREVSIIISITLGIRGLGEKHGLQKMIGAIFLASGVTCIGMASNG